MRKVLSLLLVVVLVMGFVGMVSGSTIYDNFTGTMTGRAITLGGHDYSDAYGEVMLNYRKGQRDYILKVEAWGLNPGVEYQIRTNYSDASESDGTARQEFTKVIADELGYFHVNLRGIEPGFLEFDDYEMEARILVVRVASGHRVLTTAEIGGGTLDGAGSNRGE